MDISPEASEVGSGPDVRGLRDALEPAPAVTGLQVNKRQRLGHQAGPDSPMRQVSFAVMYPQAAGEEMQLRGRELVDLRP